MRPGGSRVRSGAYAAVVLEEELPEPEDVEDEPEPDADDEDEPESEDEEDDAPDFDDDAGELLDELPRLSLR